MLPLFYILTWYFGLLSSGKIVNDELQTQTAMWKVQDGSSLLGGPDVISAWTNTHIYSEGFSVGQ